MKGTASTMTAWMRLEASARAWKRGSYDEVITLTTDAIVDGLLEPEYGAIVITSYSIHYTKLYEGKANTNKVEPFGKSAASGQSCVIRPASDDPQPLGVAMYCLPLTA